MASTLLFSLLLLLSISLFPFIIHGAKENHNHKHYTPLIQKTCKTISANDFADYDFCISTLQARPARECATLLRIGWTTIELLMSNVTDTRRHIKGVLTSGKVQRWVRRCVRECYSLYDMALVQAESLLWEYTHREYDSIEYAANNIMNYAALCDDLFVEGSQSMPVPGCGGGVSPFSARNNNAVQLSGMALAVIRLLKGELH
nr:putative invertase inhibitor [Ipomoea batatas]